MMPLPLFQIRSRMHQKMISKKYQNTAIKFVKVSCQHGATTEIIAEQRPIHRRYRGAAEAAVGLTSSARLLCDVKSIWPNAEFMDWSSAFRSSR